MKLAFYGRTGPQASAEAAAAAHDEQLRAARSLARAAGHEIVVEFFDTGVARTAPLARRRQAAAMFAELAHPERRRFDGIVVGRILEDLSGCYEELVAPVLESHGVALFAPDAGASVGVRVRARLRRPAASVPSVA